MESLEVKPLKLVKVSDAVKGAANYNRGAKTGTYVLTDSEVGEVFRICGRFDGKRRYWWGVDSETGERVGSGSLKNVIAACEKQLQEK